VAYQLAAECSVGFGSQVSIPDKNEILDSGFKGSTRFEPWQTNRRYLLPWYTECYVVLAAWCALAFGTELGDLQQSVSSMLLYRHSCIVLYGEYRQSMLLHFCPTLVVCLHPVISQRVSEPSSDFTLGRGHQLQHRAALSRTSPSL